MNQSGSISRTETQGVPWRSLAAAIGCLTVFDVTLGFSFPLITLLLEARQVDEAIIAFNAAMTPLGILLVAPTIPALSKKFGARRLAIGAAFAVALLIVMLKVFPQLLSWFVLRLILGAAGGILFTISEAWVVRFADGPHRTKILAIYASALSAGFAVGPFLIPITGIDGWLPFLISGSFAALAAIPIFLISAPDAAAKEGVKGTTFLSFLPQAPVLLCAVALFGVFDAVALTFFPIYAIRVGLGLETGSYALGVMIAGNIFLQPVIGLIADRWSRVGTMIGCAVVSSTLLMVLPWTLHTVWMWPVLIILGSAGFGVYTVALALLGERFNGDALIAGAAAFSTMWGLGAIVGPPAASSVIKLYGIESLPYFLAAVYAVYALAFSVRQMTRQDFGGA